MSSKNRNLRRKLRSILIRLKFKNWPILAKFFICMSTAFVIMIIIFFISLDSYSEERISSTFKAVEKENLQAIEKIDEYINDLRNITRIPLNDIFSNYKFLEGLHQFNRTGITDYEFQKACDSIFNQVFNYKSPIHSVFIFNTNGDSEYKIKNSTLYKSYNPKGEKWFGQAVREQGAPIVISTFRIPFISDIKDRPVYVFSIARGIVDIKRSAVRGIIMVNTSVEFLDAIANKMVATADQQIVILDNNGSLIYDTRTKGITGPSDMDFYRNIADSGLKERVLMIDGKKQLISCVASPVTGWTIINQIPMEELLKNINIIRNTTFGVTAVLIAGIFMVLIFVTRMIIRPVARLSVVARLVSKGDFNVRAPEKSRDEIGTFAKTFNIMIRRLNRLINVIYNDDIKKKDLELQVLQSQINPHFLYNALESIHMMAEINSDHETSKMAISLGKFLRYGISRRTNMVEVREEIAHLEEYMSLQKTRFDNELELVVEIDEKIAGYIIVKLILQPLVENSINHGFDDNKDKFIIKIKGYVREDRLVFEVTDNGKGMEAEQVHRLNSYINDMEASFTSIGLKNVNMRLRLYYGSNYGLRIDSTKGYGTTVIVTIPYLI